MGRWQISLGLARDQVFDRLGNQPAVVAPQGVDQPELGIGHSRDRGPPGRDRLPVAVPATPVPAGSR